MLATSSVLRICHPRPLCDGTLCGLLSTVVQRDNGSLAYATWQQIQAKFAKPETPKPKTSVAPKPCMHFAARYPVGFIFGLGFETSSEVAVLAMAVALGKAAKHCIWGVRAGTIL